MPFDHNRQPLFAPQGLPSTGEQFRGGERRFAPVTREEFDALEARITAIERQLKTEDKERVEQDIVISVPCSTPQLILEEVRRQNMADMGQLRQRGKVDG